MIRKLLAVLFVFIAGGASAQPSSWGVLDEIARREWTTEKEPRVRVSRFKWIEPGRVLEARHGFVSRLQFGETRFADTVQRFILDPVTGAINVTYTYEDGRPPLKTVIKVEADGTAVETFTDANGIRKRNIYKAPTLSLNTIERQEMRDTNWASLGTTRKAGLTAEQIAENKRRAEEAKQLAMAEARAQEAARQAEIAAQQAQQNAAQGAYEDDLEAEQQAMVANMNAELMGAIRGIGTAVQERNQQRAELNRLRVAAEQETAQRRAAEARAEANRIAAENARRAQEANARQAAIEAQYAAQRAAPDPASGIDAQPAGNAGDAERARREQEFAESQRRLAEQKREAEERAVQEANERANAIEAERQRREAEAARQKQEREQRLAEQRRRQEEANRPIAMKEGITLCKINRGTEWRCDGPLQPTYGNIEKSVVPVQEASGSSSTRDLGVVAGYRAFGCGFGMHPTSSSPGNRDIPASYGVFIGNRAIFYCPRSKDAYCQTR